jgi:hypothetical protein
MKARRLKETELLRTVTGVLSWLQRLFSSAFVLVVDLSLAIAVWCVLVLVPNLVLLPVRTHLRSIPLLLTALDAIIVAAASLVASILCVRILLRLFPYVLVEGGGLRIRNPARLLLLVALLLGGCVAFVLDEADTPEVSKIVSAGSIGVAYCLGLWFGLRNRTFGRLSVGDMQNVVFLRRFHSLADRSIIEVIRSALLPSSRLVMLRAPRDSLLLWDPIQVLFSGLSLRHPFGGVPVYVHADSDSWVGHAQELLRSAQVVIIDISELSAALELELKIVNESHRALKVVLLCDQRRFEAAAGTIKESADGIISYRRSGMRSFLRFVIGFFAVANGCFILNIALLGLLAEVVGPHGMAWVRPLWQALGDDSQGTLSVLFVLGLPLYLWTSWKLIWTARLDRASSRRIKHAVRAKLAGYRRAID